MRSMPKPFQHVMAGELDGQITGEAVRALDNDRPDPIAGDPLQHGQEAGALGHRIGAAHRRIIELGLDLIAIRLGETGDRCPLALLAVLVGTDIGRGAGAQIRYRRIGCGLECGTTRLWY